jgi:hypothetical protein
LSIEYPNAIYPIKQLNMITNNDPSKVTLTWHLPEDSNAIKSINIYYNEQGDKGSEQKITLPPDSTQTTVANLKANTKYLFKIVTVNQFNDESTPETRLYKTPNSNNSIQFSIKFYLFIFQVSIQILRTQIKIQVNSHLFEFLISFSFI